MSPARKLLVAIGGIALLTVAGTLGYMLIERMSAMDALYMTVITISTVGYREVQPLDNAGRIFTMVLIFTGVGTALYLFAMVTEQVIEGRLREFMGKSAMQRKIHHLSGHVIICGFGRFGRVVTDELRRSALDLVVVDLNPALAADLERLDLPYIIGSALQEEILDEAGIARAREIVVATPSDADNVYISLLARGKNAAIRIHARAESEVGLRHLKLAGADQVVSTYQWSAMRIATTITRPSVVDFLELVAPGRGDEVDLEEIRVASGSPLAGRSIETVEHDIERLRIVAIKQGSAPIIVIPAPSTIIAAGDFLVVIGSRPNLKRLAGIVAS